MGAPQQRHRNVDVLEDPARSDAEDSIAGLDEVVAFPAAVLTSKLISETESGIELFGFD